MAPETTATERSPFVSVEEAIEEYRQGRMVVIVDSEDRENEGDVCLPAQFVTDEHINFMATYAKGLICLTLTPDGCDRLGLRLMAPHNSSQYETAFTVSIEAAEGVSTGISAADRALTCRVAADPNSTARDVIQPGHIFPLRARPGGVLERTGQTEGSTDLAKLAGLEPSAVICEIMNPDGTMARVPELAAFCAEHGLKMVSITDMVEYRRRTEVHVEREVETTIPTRHGDFNVVSYRSTIDGREHVALVRGDVRDASDVLVRIHSECLTGDVFGSHRCDCGDQLDAALAAIDREGRGVLLYLAQEGRGIGLANKLRAYELQRTAGLDTVDANTELGFAADLREYDMAVHMLSDLGVKSVRMLTNNPAKIAGLERFGATVTERIPVQVTARAGNRDYLITKRDRLGHILDHVDLSGSISASRASSETGELEVVGAGSR